jgi:hypothetical protein
MTTEGLPDPVQQADPLGQFRTEVLKGIRQLRYTVVGLFVLLGIAAGLGYHDLSAKSKEATRSHVALCALREDLHQRIAASQDFLAAHPTGALGLSATSIQNNIANSERTIAALSLLRCPQAP